ncbi:PKD domain-containing protein [Winogradskyella thalassocola]|uniref:PKD domain-containing protein n=1 Tax=Winogradskyella thalassocola TaxID=262004 RepID=A0A1G7VXY6_9FLAO|nr:PKD domain-containing protein [Winogradskyella thalassocola]SDG64309.1 PKD domain-containing protein [Winogradskyella thalassocola]
MKNKINIFSKGTVLFLCLISAVAFNSCESAYEFDLPESGSQVDTVLPTADFSYIPDPQYFNIVQFTDLSFQSTTYLWDFGGGATSTERDPIHTFPEIEGTYPVTLTASDANGASDTVTIDVEVLDVFVPITPEVLNGDFQDGTSDWKFSSFTDGTTNPFNSSSDGSWINYDGTDNGSKTKGAKWTSSTSAGAYLSNNTRYAYQALTVSPNVEYILEYEYAIKDDGTQAPGDNRIIGGILDGHFDDGADAIVSFNAAPLAMHIGDEDLGKTVFTTVQKTFTSNASGEIAILIYGVTDVDAYVDNVKVYPAD